MELNVIGTLDRVIVGATGVTEIIQNVKTIMSTVLGTVPLDRAFGIDGEFVDQPLPVAQARAAAAMVTAVEKWEPRVQVQKITWVDDPAGAADGRLVPNVRIKLREGVL